MMLLGWLNEVIAEHGTFANIVSLFSALVALLAYNSAKNSADSASKQALEALRQNNFSLIQSRVDIYKNLREIGFRIALFNVSTFKNEDLREFQLNVFLTEIYFDLQTFTEFAPVLNKAALIVNLIQTLADHSRTDVIELQAEINLLQEKFVNELIAAIGTLHLKIKPKLD